MSEISNLTPLRFSRRKTMALLCAFVVISWREVRLSATQKFAYPLSRVGQTVDTYFGRRVPDPYRWLEDGKSKEVTDWVQAQDQLAQNYLSNLPNRGKLLDRFRSLFYINEVSTPRQEGSRLFYQRHQAEKEKPVVYWQEVQTGQQRILLDPTRLSSDGHLSVGEWYPSPDGHFFAYLLKANNADEADLHVLNVSTGQEAPEDIIPGTNYADLTWTPDSQGFYYMRLPVDPTIVEANRVANATVRFHRLGANPTLDPVIFPKTGDSRLYLSPSLSRDGQWLFVYSINGWTSTDVYFRNTKASADSFKPLFVSTSATASASAWKGHFYIDTNDGAPHHKIFEASVESPERQNWKLIVPERQDTTIQSMNVAGGRLILTLLKNAATELEVRQLDGSLVKTISLPGIGQVSDLSGREDQDDLYYQFESFTVPRQIYKTSLSSGKTSLWAKTDVPVNPLPFRVRQVWFSSKDRTPISMFIISSSSTPADGSTPFILQGYGGFNESLLPKFDATFYPWLEAGGAYAFPNLRGGGEYGETWHQAGMLARKQNTFDDFIAAAEYLIHQGYTRKDRLAIQGISNGGLLVAAALTQRPDLFQAVMCKVPLVDMIRYPLFGEGSAWVPEYGSPKQEDQFRALLAYSPYHHVKEATVYPSVLVISTANDDRVDPMHARKLTAALQKARPSAHPILLRTLQHAGHGGADLVRAKVEEWTDRTTFLMNELGIGMSFKRGDERVGERR